MAAFRFIKHHSVGILTIVIVFAVVRYLVTTHRSPGSMTIVEAQAMDMSQSGTPLGAAPVAIETAEPRLFATTVTYSGSVVAFNDAEIYPRVTGTIAKLDVYPGDRVRAGQVVARLDSAELSSRANEAAAAREAAGHDAMIASSERQSAVAESRSARAKADSSRDAMRDAQAEIDLAVASREEAEQASEAARSALANAQAAVTAAGADADYWRQEITREEHLFRAKAVSQEELERETAQARAAFARQSQADADVGERTAMLAGARAKTRQAAAAIASARARLEGSLAAVQQAVADQSAADANTQVKTHHIAHISAMAQQAIAQERTADIVRDYTVIRAAQSGTVTERLASPGTLVQPGMPILRIQSIDRVRLQANVAEADLQGIRVGSPVTVTSPRDSSLRVHTRVSAIFSAANPQTRTVTVEAIAPNAAGRLLPGQYVVMQIATAQPRLAISVPIEALHRNALRGPFVWTAVSAGPKGKTVYTCVMHPQVEEDKPGHCPICSMKLVPKQRGGSQTAHRVTVAPGASDGSRILVEGGLKEGDLVLIHGTESLNEGDPVTAVEWSAGGPVTLPKPSGDTPAMPGMSMPGISSPGKSGDELKSTNPPPSSGASPHPDDRGGMGGMHGMKGM
jgi:multidrug efflux pump subunit AcrA (membrane-fusion protein)